MNIGNEGVLQPMAHDDEHHEPLIAGYGLLEARDQAVALLEPADAAFHNVVLPVQPLVLVDRYLAITAARKHWFALPLNTSGSGVGGVSMGP